MSLYEIASYICLAVGAIVIVYYLLDLFKVIFDAYVAPGFPLNTYGANRDSWAIVTGCTDGIGKEFALQLAAKGMNVFLVSRNMDKLKAIEEQISQLPRKGQTATYKIDFAGAKSDDFAGLAKAIASLDVSILVNNVGTSHAFPAPMNTITDDEDENIINVNCLGTVKVTKAVFPSLIEHSRRAEKGSKSRALILNIGSFAGVVPTPYLATYSGSKAFLSTWSRAIADECKTEKLGIDVLNLNAYFVVSSMSKIRRPNFFTPLPKPFVRHTLAHLGRRGGAHEPGCFSVWPSHALTNWVITRIGPESWWIKYNATMQKRVRDKAFARSAKQNKAK